MAYSDDDKAGALAVLAANNGNVRETARRLGIDEKTLRVWKSGGTLKPGAGQKAAQKKRDLAGIIEAEARAAFGLAADKREGASYAQLITAGAILIDKARLLREMPTSITAGAIDVSFHDADLDQIRAAAWDDAGPVPAGGEA